MDQVQIDKIKDLIEYERNRTSPPSTFPKLPDLPGKRYTDREFFELEKENLWKKTWLWLVILMRFQKLVVINLGKQASQLLL